MVKTNSDVKSIRKKLMAAVAMLLVACIMVVSSSYAWFTLSTAPEVTGIQTSVGANGNLEMALRYDKPLADIESTSSKVEFPNANLYWGNLVDLSDGSYHLGDISLRPARLNGALDEAQMNQVVRTVEVDGAFVTEKKWISKNGVKVDGEENYEVEPGTEYWAENKVHEDDTPVYDRNVYKVDTVKGYLMTPVYGTDGRLSALEPNTVNGIYQKDAFKEGALLGVRAVGVTSNISPEALALRNAKLVVSAAINNTKSNATISLRDDSVKLAGLFVTNELAANHNFTDSDKAAVQSAINNLTAVVNELEAALKQAVVAVGVSQGQTFAPEAVTFSATDITVADVTLTWSGDLAAAKADLLDAYGKLSGMTDKLTTAQGKLDALTGGSYTFAQLSGAATTLLSTDDFLINGDTIAEFRDQDLFSQASALFATPTISIQNGIYYNVAEFSGNYDATTSMTVPAGNYGGSLDLTEPKSVTVKMITIADENAMDEGVKVLPNGFHLPYVQNWMSGLTVGTTSESANLITDIYGYAIDLAFRTNASGSSLKLQTEAANRVNDSEATQGAGSYMQFGSGHADFTLQQVAELMKSIRVVFTDDTGAIYGVAALDVAYTDATDADTENVFTVGEKKYKLTSGTLVNNQIKAPLYMYGFSVDAAGKMTLGDKSADSIITALDQNVAKGVTALVFLDGDEVDNADVATSGNSMTGTMNLQFSSSASLTPMNYTFSEEEDDEDNNLSDTPAVDDNGGEGEGN